MPPALTSPAADPNAAPRSADPLVQQLLALIGRAERPYYEVGVLLDREDFIAEQSYHRGRLARALACLFGHGTIAGLRVREPRDAADPSLPRRPNLERELEIDPGLALDRLGRLIELRTAQCFRIRRWFDWVRENDADAIDEALLGDPGAQELRLDLFVQFVVCSHGATPAFATGPYDATDATVPSREHDAYELSWALRARAEAEVRPQNSWLTPERLAAELDALPASGDAAADAAARAARRQALLTEAVLSAWEPLSPDARQPSLGPLLEQPLPSWWDRVLLARVHIPVRPAADGRPELDPTRELAIDNNLRPLVHVPGRWQGAVRL